MTAIPSGAIEAGKQEALKKGIPPEVAEGAGAILAGSAIAPGVGTFVGAGVFAAKMVFDALSGPSLYDAALGIRDEVLAYDMPLEQKRAIIFQVRQQFRALGENYPVTRDESLRAVAMFDRVIATRPPQGVASDVSIIGLPEFRAMPMPNLRAFIDNQERLLAQPTPEIDPAAVREQLSLAYQALAERTPPPVLPKPAVTAAPPAPPEPAALSAQERCTAALFQWTQANPDLVKCLEPTDLELLYVLCLRQAYGEISLPQLAAATHAYVSERCRRRRSVFAALRKGFENAANPYTLFRRS